VPDAAQWRVHEITGMAPSDGGRRAQLRHFKAINTDWDVDRLGSLARRTASSPLDPALLEPDPLLQEALARAFAGDAGPPEAAAPPVRSPWRLRLRGGRLAAEGRLDEAIAAARAAVGRLPEHPGFRLFLARLLERSGQGNEAAALRAEAEAVRLKDGLYHYQCGRRLLDEEEFAPAARALRRALRIKPTLAAAWLELARLSQRLGRPAQARRHLQRCAERVPDDPMGRAALAERLAGDGLISPALAHIEAAIARAPANPHYHVLHAELLWRMGRLDAAERAARQGMALDDLPTRLREFGDHLAARGNLGYQRWILPTAPEAACELARILLTKGDLAAAEAAVREALAVLPTRPETHEQLAGILARRGRDPEAAEALARAIALARQEVEQPVAQNLATLGQRERAEYRELRLARLLGAAGRKDEAVLVLREAVARLPASIPLQEGLAMALAAAGEPRAAAELLRAAIRRQPRNAGLCLAFCRVLEPVEPARALEAARDACRLDPDCPFFHSRLGVLLMQADELDAAAAALERAVTLAPEDASGHWRLGQLLERRGRLPEALAEFRRALELDPGQAWLWSHLGGLLTEAGELDEAEAALDRALALAPDDALGRYRLGRLLERRGRPAAALAEFRRAAALDPDQAWLWSHLGGLLMEAGAFDEAEAALERAAALAPDAALTHFRLAQLLSRRGRPEAALAATRRAAELGLEQAWLWSHLGGQLTEAGALEEAEAALERAVALAPEVALNHLRLAELLQRRGRSEEALAAARRAAELDPTSEHIRALLIEAERRSRRAVLLRRAQLASDHAYRRSKHLEYEVWQSLQYVTVSDINSIDMRLFPDFLIIGPQRTGSTWLYKRLGLHPQIYVPNEKEIYYFNNLHTSSFHPKTFPAVSPDLSWYLEHFRETEEERARRDASCRTLFNEPYDPSVRGEGTATYAAGLMPEVVDEIVILNPHIKVILLVRNPVERAWSHAKLNVPWGGNAPLDWHNSDQHAELLSRTDYDQFIEYFNRPYQIACSRFSKIIEMWKPRLRDGHLFLGRFEDISSNPESLLLAIFDFLGVRSDRKYMCEDAAKHVLPTPFLPLPGYLRTYLQQLFDDEFENLAKLGFRWE
jgi:tetratricopeptide (TPR) repeat protein